MKKIDTQKILQSYVNEEQRSLKRQVSQRKIQVSNKEIRQIITELVTQKDRVLLSSISKTLLDLYSEDKSNSALIKMRIRVLSAIQTHDSKIKTEKIDNRVWLVRK